jgi:hypothetical protein
MSPRRLPAAVHDRASALLQQIWSTLARDVSGDRTECGMLERALQSGQLISERAE